jgi:hypothetical protein
MKNWHVYKKEGIHQLLSKGVQFPKAMADDVLTKQYTGVAQLVNRKERSGGVVAVRRSQQNDESTCFMCFH